MRIYSTEEVLVAIAHQPQIERFGLSDGRTVVIESAADYKLKSLPQEVRDEIAKRNASPVAQVPQAISRTAGLFTLDDFGLSGKYTEWANAPGRTFREKVFLEVHTWRRDDPVLIAAAKALGVEDKLDDLFKYAFDKYDSQG